MMHLQNIIYNLPQKLNLYNNKKRKTHNKTNVMFKLKSLIANRLYRASCMLHLYLTLLLQYFTLLYYFNNFMKIIFFIYFLTYS